MPKKNVLGSRTHLGRQRQIASKLAGEVGVVGGVRGQDHLGDVEQGACWARGRAKCSVRRASRSS